MIDKYVDMARNLVRPLKTWFVSLDTAYGKGMVRTSLSSGESMTIPDGYGIVIPVSFTNSGDLTIDGDGKMVITG